MGHGAGEGPDRLSLRLTVRVTPKGGRDAVDGWSADEAGRPVLKVRVSAAPADGQANAAVVALIAKALGVSRSSVRIVSGETSRVKRLEVDGATDAHLAQAVGTPPG
ncbi:DUF167 family protein [Phenylobacterium sp. J426]|uniref:DUF167 domain-containing protein n=1 Tax=Phenylobacterium sp. J426 TaxID=2898439 RepID=UPI00215196BE|nr:DUF167 family protein [Phenylobacterium sp. J426]MCR5874073.1 DUF167 family protein [Phenylobacterium sp. J426]